MAPGKHPQKSLTALPNQKRFHTIDLGTGTSENLGLLAARHPKKDFLAIEFIEKAAEFQRDNYGHLKNFHVLHGDAFGLLETLRKSKVKTDNITIRIPDALLPNIHNIVIIGSKILNPNGKIHITTESPLHLQEKQLELCGRAGLSFHNLGQLREGTTPVERFWIKSGTPIQVYEFRLEPKKGHAK